ncbi:MAG: polysaccharide biosynthesis/export family protein, partial [Armatimonadetes bacterium]|nr:polysaccharide biosynthesis/export family protein [Armatimonadota bacterium]
MCRISCFIIALLIILPVTASAQEPGDRVVGAPKNFDEWIPAALPRATYRIGSGDVLAINVQGKANLNYIVNVSLNPEEKPNEVAVTPGGQVFLPLVGEVKAAGKTVVELQDLLQTRLAEYF